TPRATSGCGQAAGNVWTADGRPAITPVRAYQAGIADATQHEPDVVIGVPINGDPNWSCPTRSGAASARCGPDPEFATSIVVRLTWAITSALPDRPCASHFASNNA